MDQNKPEPSNRWDVDHAESDLKPKGDYLIVGAEQGSQSGAGGSGTAKKTGEVISFLDSDTSAKAIT